MGLIHFFRVRSPVDRKEECFTRNTLKPSCLSGAGSKKSALPLSTSLDGDDPPVTNRCTTSIFRLVWAALALVRYRAPSAAGPAENNVIGAFESSCLDNLNAPDRAIRLIDALGLPEIPDPERAILMADHPGRA
jgi:hypothetical protein